MKKNILTSLLIGLAISAVTLYLALKNVPFTDLLIYLTSINYFWIFPSVLTALISFVLRTLRWQIILESAGKVNFWRAFHPLMIGFMINCILPGRVGEIARPIILQQKENIPFPTGLATVAVERVFDAGLLVAFFAIMLTTMKIDPGLDITFGGYHLNQETLILIRRGMTELSFIIIAGIIIIGFSKTRAIIKRIIMGLPYLFFFTGASLKIKIQQKVCSPIAGLVENIGFGFALIKYPKKICSCIGLSLVIWGLAAFSYYIMALGCPGIDLSFIELSAVMIIVCFFIALPSVPGFWGIWEAGGVFELSLFGISAKNAAGFTLTNHAVQIFPVIIVGLVSAVMTGVNIWQVSYKEKPPQSHDGTKI